MFSATQIENIIRIVVERLREMDDAPKHEAPVGQQPTHGQAPSSPATATAQATAAARSTLALTYPLVTLEHLRDKLDGVQVLQVPRRAIVTPAVVDALRERGVQLLRTDAGAAGGLAGVSPLLLIAPRQSPVTNLAARRIAENEDVKANVQALKEHVSASRRPAIWSSARPFAATQAVQHHSQLRVVLLPTLGDLDRALEQAKPEVIVIDDQHWNPAAVANLVHSWGGV